MWIMRHLLRMTNLYISVRDDFVLQGPALGASLTPEPGPVRWLAWLQMGETRPSGLQDMCDLRGNKLPMGSISLLPTPTESGILGHVGFCESLRTVL